MRYFFAAFLFLFAAAVHAQDKKDKKPGDAMIEKYLNAEADKLSQKFLDGAKTAYEMIVMSFAEGDEASLKQLLSAEVFEGFESAIRERETRGEKVESNLVGINKADIIESDVKKNTAYVTVKFVSELISVTRDAEGEVV